MDIELSESHPGACATLEPPGRAGEVIEAVTALATVIASRVDEIEAGRRLPLDIVADMRTAGVFRMFVPRSHGGLELTLRDGVDVIEALARADGSVGWSAMIGCETPHVLAKLSSATFDALYADGPDLILCGAFGPQGQAVREGSGYRASGRWSIVSGCQHADLLFGNCVVAGSTPQGGPPALRSILFRPEQVEIVDTWHSLGLRGSGSHDFAVAGALVPADETFDLFMGEPQITGQTFVLPVFQFSCHMAAVGLGIAQGAFDEVHAQVKAGRRRQYTRGPLIESPVFHARFGRLDAELRAARAALHSIADELWAACAEGPAAVKALAPRVSATVAWVTATTTSVVDGCFAIGGASAVRDGSPLQRRFRDIHTVSQHVVMSDGWFTASGAALFGKCDDLFSH